MRVVFVIVLHNDGLLHGHPPSAVFSKSTTQHKRKLKRFILKLAAVSTFKSINVQLFVTAARVEIQSKRKYKSITRTAEGKGGDHK